MVVWSLAFNLAFDDGTSRCVEITKDEGGYRQSLGDGSDLGRAIGLQKWVDFSATIGIMRGAFAWNGLVAYNFRFSATTTNGAIHVLGGSDVLDAEVVTDDLVAVMVDLNADADFLSVLG